MRHWLISVLILYAPCFAGEIPVDTARLTSHLEQFRRHKSLGLSATQYMAIQREYLQWIESRLRSGATVAQMNGELKSVGLLSEGPNSVDDMFDKTYVGFLGEVEAKPALGAEDLFAIKFGFHTGGYCNFDDTVVLYERNPLRRLAQVNAERSYTHGYHLRDLAVGKDDPGRGRIIGSAWVASNCTSNWNGNIFRIDVSHGRSLENVLDRSVSAFAGDPVTIGIENDTVTFRYGTSAGDLAVLAREAIARFRVQGGRAIREAPIAPSFGGFVHEWLNLTDADAARWSTSEAAHSHHDLAARLNHELLEWKGVASCPGSPPAREIVVEWSESKQTTVFRISETNAAELRMLSVSGEHSPGCREIDITGDLTSIFGEPRSRE